MTGAAYDEIADWYETEFLRAQRVLTKDAEYGDFIGIEQAVVELLGPGAGLCLDVGCGTGIYADRMRRLGRDPVGIDISAGMLRYARQRLPVASADACALPFASGSIPAAVAVMIHTDIPIYPAVLAEVHRVLTSGGTFVHVGVHPCFCGSFADRTDNDAIIIRRGYLEGGWTPGLGADHGVLGKDGQVRDKVGAAHYPLASLANAMVSAGFRIEKCAEGGAPTPVTLSLRASK